MSLNNSEIDKILDELDLASSRIERISQPDRFSIYLETYGKGRKQKIQIGLYHNAVRICRINKKPKLPLQPPRFAQLLSSRLKGAFIQSVSQPESERLIHFIIRTYDGQINLWIRLWGGNPNAILSDEKNVIIDTLFRRKDQNEIAGKIYNPDFTSLKKGNSSKERTIRFYEGFPDLNSYINFYYNENHDEIDFIEKQKALIRTYEKKLKSLQSLKEKLKNRLETYSSAEMMQISGDLTANNLHRLKKGMLSFETENYITGEQIIIPLKEDLSPVENRDLFYSKARKYRKGYAIANSELQENDQSIKEILDNLEHINSSSTLEELSKWTLKPKESLSKRQNESSLPGLRFYSGNYVILVGRNSRENDSLLRHYAKGNDIWLHVRQHPGGFVFIKSIKGKSIPLETLLDGANLALLYSSAKKRISADVHYTEVKNLRRMKGGTPGQVIVHKDKNIHIEYDEKRISNLKKQKS